MNSVRTYYGGSGQVVASKARTRHKPPTPVNSTNQHSEILAPSLETPHSLPEQHITIKNQCTSVHRKLSPPKKSKPRKQPVRPSLSEQLAAIGHGAEEITKGIRSRLGGGPPARSGIGGESAICTIPVKGFCVGNLSCRYPAPISFYDSYCEFQFHHPYENSIIEMLMRYCDMTAIVLSGSRFTFNIPRQLIHFKLDYNPSVHAVVVEFVGSSAVAEIQRKVTFLMNR